MKKLGLLVMPLMAISLLASYGCSNKGPKPTEYITHKFTFHGTNCKINGASEYSHDIYENDKNVQYTIIPNTGYELPETIDSNIPYDNKTGVITISEIKSDIELNVGAIPLPPVPGLKHKIHLDPGGGQFGEGQLSILENIDDGDSVPNTPVLVREGYDVSKVTWLIDDTTDVFTFGPKGTGTEVRDDYFLHAKWEDKLQVKVNFVETSLKTETFDVPYGERAAYYKPKQSGFNFIDWYDSDPEDPETGAQAQPFKFEDPIKEETNIYAKWEAISGETYNVKFSGVTDCTVTYKGESFDPSVGKDITVPKGVDPYYVKFVIKAKDTIYMKPGHVTLTSSTDYTFDNDTGELLINVQSANTVTVNCDIYKTLEECSWAQIKTISEAKEAPNAFRIGDEKIVKVNNLIHKIRIIGFNHDYSELPDDGEPELDKVLGITFEFANVITKENKVDAYTTPWASANNYDYRKSTINNFLNNDVLNMLPSSGDPNNPDLREVIKPVDKKVGVSTDKGENYIATSFDGNTFPYPYLFPLAHDEIFSSENFVAEKEGSKYQYYIEHLNETDRIKKKVDASGDKGEYYWLRSPITIMGSTSWNVDDDGASDSNSFNRAYAVAPAFCI